MRKKSFSNLLIKALSCMFVLAFVLIVSQYVSADAATKQVRVNTLDELKAAVEDSKVDVIYLNTDIYDTYTIPAMENAKDKELKISAPNLDIVNKSVWKDVQIRTVGSFKEAVSGNNIMIPAFELPDLEIAKKVTVEKLILADYIGYEGTFFYYTLRKGAKVNEIYFLNNDYSYVQASKKNLIVSTYAFEWGEPAVVSIKFDKSGRILQVNEDFEYENSEECVFKYDKNGNLLSTVEYAYTNDEKTVWFDYEYEYDSKNRRILEHDKIADIEYIEYKYNKKGKLVSEIGYNEKDKKLYEKTNTYYKNGRLKKEVFVTIYDQKITTTYKYNEYGLVTAIKETNSAYPNKSCKSTYLYDDNLNNTVYKYVDYEGFVTKYYEKHDEYGDWISTTVKNSDGEEYTYTPDTAG